MFLEELANWRKGLEEAYPEGIIKNPVETLQDFRYAAEGANESLREYLSYYYAVHIEAYYHEKSQGLKPIKGEDPIGQLETPFLEYRTSLLRATENFLNNPANNSIEKHLEAFDRYLEAIKKVVVTADKEIEGFPIISRLEDPEKQAELFLKNVVDGEEAIEYQTKIFKGLWSI